MWDILYRKGGKVYGEGLQNGTETEVVKNQLRRENGKREEGERRDGREMEGEEENEKRRQDCGGARDFAREGARIGARDKAPATCNRVVGRSWQKRHRIGVFVESIPGRPRGFH